MKSRALCVSLVLSMLALLTAVPALAQDQLNLADGGLNSFFFGGGSNHITLTLPTMNCSGGTCTLAAASASGTGDLAGSGMYTITAPAGAPVPGGFAGPFSLNVRADGSSMVNQTAPITLSYSSSSGTLTGLLTFTNVSPTVGFTSSMTGTFAATGGSFAQFFPNGATATITLGLGFPLQDFPITMHAFAVVEFQNGTIVANAANGCMGTLPLRINYQHAQPTLYDLVAPFTQTNNPSQIGCTTASPCGNIDVALGTGSFSGDLVVTVNLSGSGQDFQADRIGFNSDVSSALSLQCFSFSSSCSSGVGGASLAGSMQEDGFGRFSSTLSTGLNGGSGCSNDGTGCQNLFTFVVGDSNRALALSDFGSYVAAHIANGTCSGYIATTNQ